MVDATMAIPGLGEELVERGVIGVDIASFLHLAAQLRTRPLFFKLVHTLKRKGPTWLHEDHDGRLVLLPGGCSSSLKPSAARPTGRRLTIATTLVATDDMGLISLHLPLQRAGCWALLADEHLKKLKSSLSNAKAYRHLV